ncbi:FUSC family protein [Cryobacterium tepidiphilum]|uniref:FUSC family protein n=1 Tax=Cryobacterium tepidiphilum TaxID=2486026 RepID=A0A3M8LGG3_9MICO|nr:FUSC family protein [Cryobacterium tepidiphilum]RNE63999.1 FUSC family protein [Cryobacterium tepidiphilum]
MSSRQDDERTSPESLLDRIRSLRALDIEVASRAALAAVVPLVVLIAIGHIEWAPYASFGAMTALYGRSEPYRIRARTVTVAAVALVASIALGIATALASPSLIVLAAGLIVVIVAGILLSATAGLFPPTPIFFVFAYTVCAQVPTRAADVGLLLAVAAASAAFAWLLTMSGWAVRRVVGERSADWFKGLPRRGVVNPVAYRDAEVWRTIAQNVVGVLIAGALATLVGIGHSYWAVVSVVAVLPPPGARHSTSRAWHRIIGTLLGVVVTGLILLPAPPLAVLIVVIGIGQFGAEILVGRHYGAALLFITPLALTVSRLASPVPVSTLLFDRAVETALGGGIAILIVLFARARADRRERGAAGMPA